MGRASFPIASARVAAFSALALAALDGCDLFHSTAGIVNECGRRTSSCAAIQGGDGGTSDATVSDATADARASATDAYLTDAFGGPPSDGGSTDATARLDGAETDAGPSATLCRSRDAALSLAAHSCAWLGACDTAVFANALGSCLASGILAFDCAANPNQRPRGAALAFWSCLANVGDGGCPSVDRCVFGEAGKGACSGGPSSGEFAACGRGDAGDVLAVCTENGALPVGGLDCAATGQTCVSPDLASLCAGAATASCQASDAGPSCRGTSLVSCGYSPVSDTTVDQGYDCASYGAGACVINDAAAPACVANGGTTCAQTPAVSCDPTNSIATGCPSGVAEVIDCSAITGPGTCRPTTLVGAAKVASACVGSDSCTADSCSGDNLVACVQGARVAIACSSVGLVGPCVRQTSHGSLDGDASAVGCTPP